jgi:hypothetical protein
MIAGWVEKLGAAREGGGSQGTIEGQPDMYLLW